MRSSPAPATPRLHTPNLALIAATPAHLRAELAALACPSADHPLGPLLGVDIPANWPPDLYEADDIERSLATLEGAPDAPGWNTWYLIERGTLIGIAGFECPPDTHGVVTLGYSVIASARRRGLATEATAALTVFAFRDPRVRIVAAETLPQLTPSIRVLEKCGFQRVETAREPGAVRFEKRRSLQME